MADLKPVREMTPVELLSEFCKNREYHETVAEARAWMATDDAKAWIPGPAMWERMSAGWLCLRRHGQPLTEVRAPRPAQDQRWTDLCAEINRRFTPSKPPFTGPYR